MRSREAVLHCDSVEVECDHWDWDYYTQTASSVDGVQITRDAPAPGWVHTNFGDDYCPQHAAEATS